jgi:hypothetical protein
VADVSEPVDPARSTAERPGEQGYQRSELVTASGRFEMLPSTGQRWHRGLMSKELSTKDRKKLGKKSFALPGQRKYPIPDKPHARNALARVAQHGTPAEQKKVRAAVKKRFPSIGNKKKA